MVLDSIILQNPQTKGLCKIDLNFLPIHPLAVTERNLGLDLFDHEHCEEIRDFLNFSVFRRPELQATRLAGNDAGQPSIRLSLQFPDVPKFTVDADDAFEAAASIIDHLHSMNSPLFWEALDSSLTTGQALMGCLDSQNKFACFTPDRSASDDFPTGLYRDDRGISMRTADRLNADGLQALAEMQALKTLGLPFEWDEPNQVPYLILSPERFIFFWQSPEPAPAQASVEDIRDLIHRGQTHWQVQEALIDNGVIDLTGPTVGDYRSFQEAGLSMSRRFGIALTSARTSFQR